MSYGPIETADHLDTDVSPDHNTWMLELGPDKQRLFAATRVGLTQTFHSKAQPIHRWFVPGRLEFLGKHTDYCRGRSIFGAIDRGICFCASARSDTRLRMLDVQSGQIAELDMYSQSGPAQHDWTLYPATVARRLASMFPVPIQGADVAFISDLPPAAGLSSSSCLIVGFYLALARVNTKVLDAHNRTLAQDPVALGDFLGCVESGRAWREYSGDNGVGTRGGSQDHTAILCATPNSLTGFDFYESRSLASVALPADVTIAIAISGISAHKTGNAGAAYNRVSRRAAACLDVWNKNNHPPRDSLEAVFRATADGGRRIRAAIQQHADGEFSTASLLSRLEQYDMESHILIPAALTALRKGHWQELGRLVDQSQRLAETCLHNQVPQTQRLAASARGLGAVAASAFGAGFGGAVWALVAKAEADDFLMRWQDAYAKEFPQVADHASFFLTRLGFPATELPMSASAAD
ncbi:MAG: galactokinase family protein [Phycisphaerae bacterium]